MITEQPVQDEMIQSLIGAGNDHRGDGQAGRVPFPQQIAVADKCGQPVRAGGNVVSSRGRGCVSVHK